MIPTIAETLFREKMAMYFALHSVFCPVSFIDRSTGERISVGSLKKAEIINTSFSHRVWETFGDFGVYKQPALIELVRGWAD